MRVRKAVVPVIDFRRRGNGNNVGTNGRSGAGEVLLIQSAISMATAAGIDDFVFAEVPDQAGSVTASWAMAAAIQRRHAMIETLSELLPVNSKYVVVSDHATRGLAHALGMTQHLIGNEPFAVLAPEFTDGDAPPSNIAWDALALAVAAFDRSGVSVVAVDDQNGVARTLPCCVLRPHAFDALAAADSARHGDQLSFNYFIKHLAVHELIMPASRKVHLRPLTNAH